MIFDLLFLDFLTNPEEIIKIGGLTLLLFIIFAETGLFFGFFLPGDSLLFIAGLFCKEYLKMDVWLLIVLLVLCAIAGTCVGYFFGKLAENYLRNKKENFFYKKKYLDMAQDFYARHGMMAFIMGRFLPIVRTFVPILAGMVKIEFGKFLFFNIVGAAIWIVVMVMAGYLLGKTFPTITDHLELIVVGMVLLSAVPVVVSWFRHRKQIAKNDQNI
ncbi:DedA family protein [Pseudochryseolinea flava]|uniref:DedA family protein n=1 Tax=Pseudochryseolinea flava TaxID=2059302 RepID=A0A364XXQ3_9BACT|nr:VTT domain-containing protein [Pseudochryseolinea flava]RAV99061.1 DedA family protein [Pseudochryseolinea flava]